MEAAYNAAAMVRQDLITVHGDDVSFANHGHTQETPRDGLILSAGVNVSCSAKRAGKKSNDIKTEDMTDVQKRSLGKFEMIEKRFSRYPKAEKNKPYIKPRDHVDDW